MPSRRYLFATALACFLLLFPSPSRAQSDPAVGIPPNTSKIPIPLGFVDALTGQVHLEIPIDSVPERNGIPFQIKLVYDTTSYSPAAFSIYVPVNGNGWLPFFGTTNTGFLALDRNNFGPCPDNYPKGSRIKYSHYRFVDANGTVHRVQNTGVNQYVVQQNCFDIFGNPIQPRCEYCTFTGFSTDGAGYYFDIDLSVPSSTVWAPDGTVVASNTLPSFTSTDTNGNTGGQFSQDPFTWTQNASGCVLEALQPGNSYINVKVSDGSTQTYTLNCQQFRVAPDQPGFSGIINLISSLVLPDGSQYTFTYDAGNTGIHSGVLTGVTLPTGAQVSFGYLPLTSNYFVNLASVTFGGNTWNFDGVDVQGHEGPTTVTAPPRYDAASKSYIRDKTVYTATPPNLFAPRFPQTIQYYSGSSALVKTENRTYTPGGCLTSIATTLNDTGQTAKTTYIPRFCSLPFQIQEWDYGATSPTRTTNVTYLSDTSSTHYNSQYHMVNRPMSVLVYAGDGTTGSPIESTTYTYDEYGANYCSVPMLANITGTVNHDDAGHSASFWARGNVTSMTRMVSGSKSVTSHVCYDTLGKITQKIDAAGSRTSYDYTENWADAACIPSGTLTRAFPTTITDALGHRAKASFYSCTGLKHTVQDENDIRAGRNGAVYTYDFLSRPLLTTYADGGSESYSYQDTSPAFTSTLTKAIAAGVNFTEILTADSLGRPTQTALTSDPDGTTYTATAYDTFGRPVQVYNPTRCNPPATNCGESTWGITTNAYDALGRITAATLPDGSVSTISYSGNTTTVTDQAGKSRKSVTDGLGRLSQVFEDPALSNYETDYSYDALNNLLSVNQKGGSTSSANWRTRTFTYNSLSQLLTASNPESGTITYTYDNAGNLLTKKDARNITATYAYDALNRLTQKSFSDTTPLVKYGYDNIAPSGCTPPTLTITNGVGRRTGMCDAAGSEAWSYDTMGRIATEKRTTNNLSKTIPYTYNLDGSLATVSIPSWADGSHSV